MKTTQKRKKKHLFVNSSSAHTKREEEEEEEGRGRGRGKGEMLIVARRQIHSSSRRQSKYTSSRMKERASVKQKEKKMYLSLFVSACATFEGVGVNGGVSVHSARDFTPLPFSFPKHRRSKKER